ncbi:MAG: sulfur carrier protein ThiS [Candidatus Sulfotelmatobacter sp.]
MNLYINGDERAFPDSPTPFTLAALIESLDMKSDRVAVELNRDIVPRDHWSQTQLKDGDRLEIVHFVGGGRPDTVLKGRGFSRPTLMHSSS